MKIRPTGETGRLNNTVNSTLQGHAPRGETPICVDELGHVFLASDQCMSLRDYFAGKAMAAILATVDTGEEDCPAVALMAYTMADAMVKAREA